LIDKPLQNPFYKLRLSGPETYCFTGLDEAAAFVRKFSKAMRLEQHSEAPGISVTIVPHSRRQKLPQHIEPVFWYDPGSFDREAIRIWVCPGQPGHYWVEIADNLLRGGRLTSPVRSIMDIIYTRSIEQGGLPIHGGLLVKDGHGVIIAAGGETGKSTCCRRIEEPWVALCDDQALIRHDDGGEYRVHPFPTWSDILLHERKVSWQSSRSVRLVGIFLLQQAAKDSVESLGQGESVVRLAELSVHALDLFNTGPIPQTHAKPVRSKIFANAAALIGQVPVYVLGASLRGKFWEKIEETLGL
jgi:SynChlorMet cassette protein ScmC